MQQLPRFALSVNDSLTKKMADFGYFPKLSAQFLCQGPLFHLCEKQRLKAARDSLKKEFPGANPRRGQERKEA
jgi:hypothetical protein